MNLLNSPDHFCESAQISLIFAWRLARSWLASWPWLRIIWHCSTWSLSFHEATLPFSVVLDVEQRSRKEILVTRVFLLLCLWKVAQTGRKLYGPPASASRVLDWQVCTNKPVYKGFMGFLICIPCGVGRSNIHTKLTGRETDSTSSRTATSFCKNSWVQRDH